MVWWIKKYEDIFYDLYCDDCKQITRHIVWDEMIEGEWFQKTSCARCGKEN